MNIHELEQQATPGLARTTETYDDGISGSTIQIGDKCWQRFHTPHGLDPDALLFVHCRNHFLRALEALKEKGHDEGCAAQIRGRCSCGFNKLIAELEEVK